MAQQGKQWKEITLCENKITKYDKISLSRADQMHGVRKHTILSHNSKALYNHTLKQLKV